MSMHHIAWVSVLIAAVALLFTLLPALALQFLLRRIAPESICPPATISARSFVQSGISIIVDRARRLGIQGR
jgi:hypothetical protein